MEATRLVRRFQGHRAPITDLQLSCDSRWLLVATADGHIRVWDVPESRTLQVQPFCPAHACACVHPPCLGTHATGHHAEARMQLARLCLCIQGLEA